MDEAVKYASLAIAAVCASLLVKKAEPAYAFGVTLIAGACICIAAVGALSVIVDFLRETSRLFDAEDGTLAILLRILGVTLTTQFSAQVCRDCGEGTLAMQLELLGTVLATVNALPLLAGVLTLLKSFL